MIPPAAFCDPADQIKAALSRAAAEPAVPQMGAMYWHLTRRFFLEKTTGNEIESWEV